jgi:hypothetical protein
VIHSQKERRYQCKRCRRTFTETKETALYRSRLRSRRVYPVARWQRESGAHCKRVHEHLVEAGKVTLLQVQADEIRVKAVGRIYWLASALEVRSRLWLGAVIGGHRDATLIRSLLERIRRSGPPEHILLVTDGLASYKSQALKVFRKPLHSGKVGCPRLMLAEGVMMVRLIKRRQRK